jgi:hypothetical protein
MIMLMASRRAVMGEFALTKRLVVFGWLATAVMGAAAAGMFATWGVNNMPVDKLPSLLDEKSRVSPDPMMRCGIP